MPGIFGFIRKRDFSEDNNRALLSRMKSRLDHNPNYESEIFSNNWCGVGNIGLPFFGEQRLTFEHRKAAAFSGYIYGWNDVEPEYSRVTPNKAERLLRIFEKYGQDLPKKIDGSYNAVVIDLESKETFICNDRFGHRQLYYYEDDDLFLFSTEFKAFLAYDGYIKNLNLEAVSDYFNFDYVLGDETFLQDIKILKGGNTISILNGRTRIRPYWDFKFGEESKQSLPELIEEADSIYRDIIRKRVGNAPDIILPLSGGLDSRFILAHMVAIGAKPKTFTHGKKNCLDHRIARKVARQMEIEDYAFIELDPLWLVEHGERFVFLTEGMTESSPAILLGIGGQYGLQPESTIFLNGIYGGPTNFGGPYFREYDLAGEISHPDKLKNIRRSLFGESLDENYYGLFTPEFRRIIKSNYMPRLDREFSDCLDVSKDFHNQKDVFFIRNRLIRYMDQVDCNRFIWHDHFALSDDRLLDFYIKLPARLKLSRSFFIEYFKAKFPELAMIPYQATGTNLYEKPSPLKIRLKRYSRRLKYYAERISRGHLRFFDTDNYHHFNQWYRSYSKIRGYYEDMLLDDRTISRGYFNKESVELLLRRQRLGGNSFYEISTLASFEQFNRLFIDS